MLYLKEGLRRQIGIGTFLSIQKQRALHVTLINGGSSARFVPPLVDRRFSQLVPLRDALEVIMPVASREIWALVP